MRTLLTQEKDIAVVLLFTVLDSGYTCQEHMSKIGANYDLPMISVHDSVYEEIEAGRMTWQDYSNDQSHPNAYGHKCITDFVDNYYQKVLPVVAENVGEVMANCPKIKHAVDLSDENFFAGIYEKYSAASEYAPLSDYEVDPDKCAVIIFTSGTTGVKKGVMLSTNALVGNIMYKEYINIFSERTSTLSVLPMHHIYCFSGDYLKNLCDGVQVCLNGNLSDIVPNLERFEPNAMRVVPMIAQHLLQRIKITAAKNPDITPAEAAKIVLGKNLNWIVSGGAYLDPLLVEEYDKLGIMLRQGYGMTEVSSAATIAAGNVTKPGSVGIPMVNTVVSIFEPGTETELPIGQRGEICICTPTAMKGYYNKPEETAYLLRRHADGQLWAHTGDIGYMDEDGFVYLDARIKRIIIRHDGFKVFPSMIENVISRHPAVHQCCVVGCADTDHTQGRLPFVFVVLEPAATGKKRQILRELRQLCLEELPEYVQPAASAYKIIPEMPLTPAGKADYRKLEEEVG